MNAHERALQRQAEIREAAGLPVTLCPACNTPEAHWVPDSLERPGYFTCTTPTNGPT